MANNKNNGDYMDFDSVEWADDEGILKKDITGNRPGIHMILLKLNPNQKLPFHKHTDTRYSYVLKGEISDARGKYSKGDLVITRTGSSHSMKAGPLGCEFLVIWN